MVVPGVHDGVALSKEFTLVHTNDFHGRYYPIEVASDNVTAQTRGPGEGAPGITRSGRAGGFACQATVLRQLREARGDENVFAVHAGDTFSDDLLGNLTKGEAVIRLMNVLGYDFLALGNHDFDYGWDRTRELAGLADFPMLAANVTFRETGEPIFGQPWRVVTLGGIKVGFLALGYHNTGHTTNSENIKSLSFSSGIDATRRYLPELREQSDVVVVVSHQGMAVDRKLAREVTGIDIILSGHSHNWTEPPEKIGGTWLVEAFSNGVLVDELRVRMNDKRVDGVEQTLHVLWNDQCQPAPDVSALIDKLREPHRQQLEAVVGTAGENIGRQYKAASPFDQLVGEMLRQETGADVALLPGVGYGVTLRLGPITRETLYTLLPHSSKLVTLELSGAKILKILEQSAANQKPADPLAMVGGLIQTSGMGWTVDYQRLSGSRITNVTVHGKPLAPEALYRVATHSGMLAGIHRYTTFAQGHNLRRSDRLITHIVEEHLQRRGSVSAPAAVDDILIKN
ncbi:MAG: multifunctional 2',3'-cyclic-nucleotide 2'-phosphodiesterase/5'-nucleotidase/3'-nucleotidase [Nitrospirales bacterium]|nr:MAG: multifunctional 2',3'-cyclic-nucleotide 2'-phosphodiesterase/5'-nucleotidase/3'-nucleotidase [Nitrospirales bacterium]